MRKPDTSNSNDQTGAEQGQVMRDNEHAREGTGRVLIVPIGAITESPDNTRLFDKRDTDDKAALNELATSISALGLQQYPKVRAHDGAVPWVLVYGARRLRACRDILKWPEIPVIVDEGLSREGAAEITVVENLQRRDLHPMDEARGLALLRSQGKTVKEIAARLGRREAWIKERLQLCDLPTAVQDIYRRSARMTLQQALGLHGYTHGGKDNTGFPDLMIALAEDMDSGVNPHGYLGGVAADKPHLVKRLRHAFSNWEGTWDGNHFDSKKVCTRCPFAAYREGSHGSDAFCLLPSHYEELYAKGKQKYEAAQAAKAAENGQDGPSVPAPTRASAMTKTPAQKGKETRQRRLKQKADYAPQVAAIERLVDMIPAVDGIDVAVLAAYTLTLQHVDEEAVAQVMQRHGLKTVCEVWSTPSRQQIDWLRQIEPVKLIRYTLEALLLTQARRARDYDPGRRGADDILALYLPGHVAPASEEAA